MENLRELAEYYFSKGINVFPNTSSFIWKDWRNKECTLKELQGYDWESAKQIYGVAGKKGVRIIKLIGIDGMSIEKLSFLTRTMLLILHLPDDYPWIITTLESVSIVVESADDVQGVNNRSYSGRIDLDIKCVILLWQADFILPSFDSRVRFICDFPKERPEHVTNSSIFKCLDTFRDKNFLDDPLSVMKALNI